MSALAERFELSQADPSDLAAIERLLVARALPTDGVEEHLPGFLVAEEGGSVLGCAGVERYGSIGLLRSVAVAASLAGRGLGHALVEGVIARAADQGVVTLYLLTTTAREYFSRMGFEVIRRDELPGALGASAELRGACPDSAVTMRRVLRARA